MKVGGKVAGEWRSPGIAGFSGQFGLAQRAWQAGKIGGGKGSLSVWFRSLRSDEDMRRGIGRMKVSLG